MHVEWRKHKDIGDATPEVPGVWESARVCGKKIRVSQECQNWLGVYLGYDTFPTLHSIITCRLLANALHISWVVTLQLLKIDIVMSSLLSWLLLTIVSWLTLISVTDMIRSVTPLWYHFISSFADHYDIIFYSYWWCHISLSHTIYLQSSVIPYYSDLILCYYCTICSLSFIMGSLLGLFHPLLIVSSTHTNNTLDVFKLGPYDLKY